jgi:hypothetical protein
LKYLQKLIILGTLEECFNTIVSIIKLEATTLQLDRMENSVQLLANSIGAFVNIVSPTS